MTEQNMTKYEKAQIISRLLMLAPACELIDVFHDVKTLVKDDNLIREKIKDIFCKYNKDNYFPCNITEPDGAVLITHYGDMGGDRFLDPKSQRSFEFDHINRRMVSGSFESVEPSNSDIEDLRKKAEFHVDNYINEHFKNGTTSVYTSDGDEKKLFICIEAHLNKAKNFWNGVWRSEWTLDIENSSTFNIKGTVKVQTHNYEDGNIQLLSTKNIEKTVTFASVDDFGKSVARVIKQAENEYQQAIADNFATMSNTTFKALRRKLPLTRRTIEWDKIVGYKIGLELSKNS